MARRFHRAVRGRLHIRSAACPIRECGRIDFVMSQPPRALATRGPPVVAVSLSRTKLCACTSMRSLIWPACGVRSSRATRCTVSLQSAFPRRPKAALGDHRGVRVRLQRRNAIQTLFVRLRDGLGAYRGRGDGDASGRNRRAGRVSDSSRDGCGLAKRGCGRHEAQQRENAKARHGVVIIRPRPLRASLGGGSSGS